MLASSDSLSAKDIKSQLELNCTDRNRYDFLDTLTGLGFLNRDGLLATAVYSNTADTDFFLPLAGPTSAVIAYK